MSLVERYKACMVLAGVGDAIGYRNGLWEFETDPYRIQAELKDLGGLENLDLRGWKVSDDQVMHLATAEALLECTDWQDITEVCKFIAKHYVLSFNDMIGRAPGGATSVAISLLEKGRAWNSIPFSSGAGGCGAAMRAMCIGLVFCGENLRDWLIRVAIESGRMTHNHPTGFFGALGSAVFTAFAVEEKPVAQWGRLLVEQIMPKAYQYLEKCGRDWENYKKDLKYFEKKFRNYIKLRKIDTPTATSATFPSKYGIEETEAFYTKISFSGWGGSSGHDSVLIAYDALLASKSWSELVNRACLHGGDSDSTGVIACALWGAMHGFEGVFKTNFANVEYKKRAENVGEKLLKLHEQLCSLALPSNPFPRSD